MAGTQSPHVADHVTGQHVTAGVVQTEMERLQKEHSERLKAQQELSGSATALTQQAQQAKQELQAAQAELATAKDQLARLTR